MVTALALALDTALGPAGAMVLDRAATLQAAEDTAPFLQAGATDPVMVTADMAVETAGDTEAEEDTVATAATLLADPTGDPDLFRRLHP